MPSYILFAILIWAIAVMGTLVLIAVSLIEISDTLRRLLQEPGKKP